MMGLDNPIHIAFLLVILLLVFGAKRLPEMGKSLGSGLRGFKDSLTGDVDTTQLSSRADTARIDDLSASHAHADTPVERTPVGPVA